MKINEREDLIDCRWGFMPIFTASDANCLHCQKRYCLVEGYFKHPEDESKKLYYFCCDICCDKWWSQENIAIPFKNDYYFLATKPKKAVSCQMCWPKGSYWTSQISDFYMFGKSKEFGVCNYCEKDKCTVVGKVKFRWQDALMHYYFCSASCGKKWWKKYGSDNRFKFRSF